MKYQLTLLDICLPDYFRGYHKPVLQVPVWKDMTKQELMGCIREEYNMVYEHLTYENAWPDLSDRQLHDLTDEFITVDEPFIHDDLPTLEEHDEDMDMVYIYINCEEVAE